MNLNNETMIWVCTIKSLLIHWKTLSVLMWSSTVFIKLHRIWLISNIQTLQFHVRIGLGRICFLQKENQESYYTCFGHHYKEVKHLSVCNLEDYNFCPDKNSFSYAARTSYCLCSLLEISSSTKF